MLLRRSLLLFLSLILCVSALTGRAADLAEAERLFNSGKILDARDLYRATWQSGDWRQFSNPSSFFYNWSLVEWKTNEKGYAVAAGLMAKRASYFSEDIEKNFSWMRSQLDPSASAIEPAYPWPGEVISPLPWRSNLVFLATLLCFFIGLLLCFREKRFTGESIPVFAFACVFFGVAVITSTQEKTSLAVAKTAAISLRAGPGEHFSVIDSATMGSIFAVSTIDNHWLQLRYHRSHSPTQTAWAPEADLVITGP